MTCQHPPTAWVMGSTSIVGDAECGGCGLLLRDILIPKNAILAWLEKNGTLVLPDGVDEEAAIDAAFENMADEIVKQIW